MGVAAGPFKPQSAARDLDPGYLMPARQSDEHRRAAEQDDDFSLRNLAEIMEQRDASARVLTLLLGAVASVSWSFKRLRLVLRTRKLRICAA